MGRINLPDGFIEFRKIGNTFAGRIANDIMLAAWRIQRDTKRVIGVEPDLNKCINALVAELEKQGKI